MLNIKLLEGDRIRLRINWRNWWTRPSCTSTLSLWSSSCMVDKSMERSNIYNINLVLVLYITSYSYSISRNLIITMLKGVMTEA